MIGFGTLGLADPMYYKLMKALMLLEGRGFCK